MIFRRFVLSAIVVCVPAFAQTEAGKLAPRQFHPVHDRVDHGDGTSTSSNWSGYAVTGSTFTAAKGSWVVPAAVCAGDKKDEYAAFWVGLDGFSSNSVEQLGTDSDCDKTRPSYYAWYEFYPNPSYEITSVAINPGNYISASVTYASDKFTVTITNVTTGKSFTKTEAVKGAARSSAEWIAEAPCCTNNSGILPMSDFGTALFGGDYTSVTGTDSATVGSTGSPIGNFGNGVQLINKTSSSTSPQTSTCSPLSSDGTSFSCAWGSGQ